MICATHITWYFATPKYKRWQRNGNCLPKST